MKKILIIGGGFAGIKCALDLEKSGLKDSKITLVSNMSHFEYHALLYRVVTGVSPLEVCISLNQIFKNKHVEVVKDEIAEVDIYNKQALASSQSRYTFDYLVLALGSETDYFNVQGLQKNAFTLKTTDDALKLKRHVHNLFCNCEKNAETMHLVIVGAGPTGVELSAQLAAYSRSLAKMYKTNPSLVSIDLFERESQVIPRFPADVSQKIEQRLRLLGVNVYLNQPIVKEDFDQVYLKDMQIKTHTVVWTSGVKANHLYSQIKGLELDNRGRVIVNDLLQAKNFTNVYIAGDGAATKYSGMAHTAIIDGSFVAQQLVSDVTNQHDKKYIPQKPQYIIPVGPGWAVFVSDNIKLYGRLAWIIKLLRDLSNFMLFLPFEKALTVLRYGKVLEETCEVCNVAHD